MIFKDGRVQVGHSDVIQDARARFGSTRTRRRILGMIVLRSVGFTFEDIAECFDTSRGNVRNVINANIAKLQRAIEEKPSAENAEETLAALLRDQQADDASDYVDYANAK